MGMKKTWGNARKRTCPSCLLPLGKGKIVLVDGAAYHKVCGDMKNALSTAFGVSEAADLERKKAGLA